MACPSFCKSLRLEARYKITMVSTPRENSHKTACSASRLPSKNVKIRSAKQSPTQTSIVRQTIGIRPSARKIHAKTL